MVPTKHPFEVVALAEGGMPVAAGPPVDREEERDSAFLLAALAEGGMPISAGGPGPMPSVSVRPLALPTTASTGGQVRSGSHPTD